MWRASRHCKPYQCLTSGACVPALYMFTVSGVLHGTVLCCEHNGVPHIHEWRTGAVVCSAHVCATAMGAALTGVLSRAAGRMVCRAMQSCALASPPVPRVITTTCPRCIYTLQHALIAPAGPPQAASSPSSTSSCACPLCPCPTRARSGGGLTS
jgi:hypothetical protein